MRNLINILLLNLLAVALWDDAMVEEICLIGSKDIRI